MIGPDLLGWVGNIFFVSGACLIAKKRIEYFYCHMVGNVCYTIAAWILELWSLVAISIFLFVLACYGWYKWRIK